MIYLSLDIETTGLDPQTCDVLEVGAYFEDTLALKPREQLPCFHKYLWKDNYRGEPYALQMNQAIFQKILALKKEQKGVGKMYEQDFALIDGDYLWEHFCWWCYQNRKLWAGTPFDNDKENRFHVDQPSLIVAGKNVAGFDLPFLKQLPGFPKFHHRVIDPGMMYFDAIQDKVPPDLKECKKRAHLPEAVSHEALDDAWDVIQLIRYKHHV